MVARWRGVLAGLLAAAAVATALPALLPEPAPGADVLVAVRDLPAGTPLADGDVVPGRLPEGVVPDGALRPGEPLVGRLLAGPVRRGEALTDVRLLGPGLLAGVDPGGRASLVAVPVRLADAASAALLRPGDRVDVLAAATSPDAPPSAAVVAAAAPVLAVPAPGPDLDGALVVLATPAPAAARLAAAAVSSRLSAVVVG